MMMRLFIGLIFIGFLAVSFFLMNGQPSRVDFGRDLKTTPVFYTHRFEMELHKDTMFYPILIWEGWDFVYPIFCNSWYPTCGGCIVYDGWPYSPGFPYPGFNKASMIGWPLANTNQDTLSSSADSLLVAKELMAIPDSIIITPSDAEPTPSRWTRFKQKVRSFRIFSSS
jgi:hypothetical protein